MTPPSDDVVAPAIPSLRARVARGGMATALGTALSAAVDFCATVITARILSPADFGLVGMVIAVTGFLDMFRDMGFATVTVQRQDLSGPQLSAFFWLNLAIGVGLTLLGMALAPVLSWGYGVPALTGIALALALNTLLGALSLQHQALLRRRLEFERLAAVETGSAFASAVAAVLAALAGFGVWALVVRALVRPASAAIVAFAATRWWPGWPRRAPVRDLLAMGGHLTGFQAVNYLERNLDNVLVGKVCGAFELGCYSRAYDMLRLPLAQIGAPASTVALPALSRLLSEPARYRDAYLRMLRSMLLLTLPLCPFLVICADWIVPLAFGPQWLPAVPIFQWLGLGLALKPIAYTTSWLFVSQGRTLELLRWGLLATTLAIASFVVGLRWGATGVAASYTILDLLLRAPLLFYWVGRSGPVGTRDIVRASLPVLFASALVGTALAGMRYALPAQTPTAVGAALGALVTLALTPLAMSIIPGGRRTFSDAAALFRGARN